MLYCCGKWFYDTKKMYLSDTEKHTKRVLEVGTCSKCLTQKAVLTYIDQNGIKKEHKPKKKDVKSFIDECLSQPYYELKPIKQGGRQNMFWLYNSSGTIKDFNDETKGSCKTDLQITFITDILTPSNHSGGVFY